MNYELMFTLCYFNAIDEVKCVNDYITSQCMEKIRVCVCVCVCVYPKGEGENGEVLI